MSTIRDEQVEQSLVLRAIYHSLHRSQCAHPTRGQTGHIRLVCHTPDTQGLAPPHRRGTYTPSKNQPPGLFSPATTWGQVVRDTPTVDLDVLRVFRPRGTVHNSVVSCMQAGVDLSSVVAVEAWVRDELARGHTMASNETVSVISWVVHYVYDRHRVVPPMPTTAGPPGGPRWATAPATPPRWD
jgi:hypothetical protein